MYIAILHTESTHQIFMPQSLQKESIQQIIILQSLHIESICRICMQRCNGAHFESEIGSVLFEKEKLERQLPLSP